jgi:hypothetical protein
MAVRECQFPLRPAHDRPELQAQGGSILGRAMEKVGVGCSANGRGEPIARHARRDLQGTRGLGHERTHQLVIPCRVQVLDR